MADKKFGRREFLKLTAAATAAQGLSHFRFLNFGGLEIASAKEEPDECLATITGTCTQGDICYPIGGQDLCDPNPPNLQDNCNPPDDADTCYIPPGDPDECNPQLSIPDYCEPPPSDPDTCNPALQEQDTCSPPAYPNDVCDPQFPAEEDICVNVAGGYSAPDICEPSLGDPDECDPVGMPEDICDPPANPTDTSDVTLTSFGASASSMSFFGGVAVLLAGAALWLRRRLKSDESEMD